MDNSPAEKEMEVLKGYVVDIACLRKFSQKEVAEIPQRHTTRCALMGHCMESGYALVNNNGKVMLLDDEATPKIVAALTKRAETRGIELRVTRQVDDGQMKTVAIEVVPPEQ